MLPASPVEGVALAANLEREGCPAGGAAARPDLEGKGAAVSVDVVLAAQPPVGLRLDQAVGPQGEARREGRIAMIEVQGKGSARGERGDGEAGSVM